MCYAVCFRCLRVSYLRLSLKSLVILLWLSGLWLLNPGLAVGQSKIVIRQTPYAVANGPARFVAHYNPAQMLRLAFVLRPPHMQEEETFLRELQDLNSPLFHKFLTEEEWN